MIYKVVPFVAAITQKDTTATVAEQLSSLINEYSIQGWEYVRMENVETNIAPDSGCFGIGAKPGFTRDSLLLFSNNELAVIRSHKVVLDNFSCQ